MSRDDTDFAAYLAARWPTLVRTVVLLGVDRAAAEQLVCSAMARCRLSWERVRASDDVDTHVYAAVLAGWHRQLPRRSASAEAHAADHDQDLGPEPDQDAEPDQDPEPDQDAEPDQDPEVSDAVLIRRALQPELERIAPQPREVLVLHHVAGLDQAHLAEVLDVAEETVRLRLADAHADLDLDRVRAVVDPQSRRPPLTIDEVFWRASESLEVWPAPYDDVIGLAADRQRRRTWRVLVGAAFGVVLVAGLIWLGTRAGGPDSERDGLAALNVTDESNPAPVVWYADGVLHLDRGTVDLPPLSGLLEMNGGAVYADRKGQVAFVAADGQQRVLGQLAHPGIGRPLVGSSADGWAAWVDADGVDGSGPSLIVYDVNRGTALAPPEPTGDEVVPLAIDQRRVFYRSGDGTFAWDPRTRLVARDIRADLADIESAVRVYQLADAIDLVQPYFSVDHIRPGVGAELSPGGSYVITRDPRRQDRGDGFTPILYDVRSGDRIRTGVRADEVAIDAVFADDGTAVYLVGSGTGLGEPSPGPSPDPRTLVLRSCGLGGPCTDLATMQAGAGEALLAR